MLQQSERHFRAIYESTAVGIGLTDTAGRVFDHNRAFGEMLGLAGEEPVPKKLSEFTAGDEASVGDELFDELVGGKRESYTLEQRYRRADGEEVWGHLTASVVRDADGNPEFTVAMVHDVSDRKRSGASVPGGEARRHRPPRRRRRARLQQPADGHHRAQRFLPRSLDSRESACGRTWRRSSTRQTRRR
jgi:PAS domain S-box-containing protein